MLLEKKWIGSIAAILMFGLFLMNGCSEKKSEEKTAKDMTEHLSNETTAVADIDMGLPMYPGAEQDPEQPPINTPHMKNIKLLTSDSFDEVVEWYSQKLGEFDVEHQEKGYQALWSKKTKDGIFQAATVTTIFAPAGKVAIILVKGKTGKR